MKKRLIITAMGLAFVSLVAPARAASYSWTGNGSSDSWYSSGNWGGAAPSDDQPNDYVFTASGWNTAQSTAVVDSGGYPDVNSLTFNSNASVPCTIQLGSGSTFYLDPSSSGATTISVAQTGVYTIAPVAGSSGATIQLGDTQQWSLTGNLVVSAVLWDDGESNSPGFVKTGAGTLTLSGNNAFSGPISVNQGTVSIATIANKGQACNLGRGDGTATGGLTLNGGTLLYTGTGASSNRGCTLGTAGGTINVQNAAASLTFTGAVTGAGLTKAGSGQLTLAGATNYTGVTTISAGTLEINNASLTTNVLTDAGGVNITGGELILDYNNGVDPASEVQSLLTTSHNNGFLTGQIRDTSATSSVGLAWVDNTATKQVTIMPALYGDANLDGKVDGSDLVILSQHWNSAGTWTTGDFNYDGQVDGSDLVILSQHWNSSIAGMPFSEAMAADFAATPEPGTLALLATAALALAARLGFRQAQKQIQKLPRGAAAPRIKTAACS